MPDMALYVLAGLLLLAIILYFLRADPAEVAKEREEFYRKLYKQDATRYSRR